MNSEQNHVIGINPKSLILYFKQYRYSFIAIFLSSMILLSIYISNIAITYRSSAVLYSSDESNQGSASSQLGGLASMAGINLSSGDSNVSLLAIEKIKSKDFIDMLLTNYDFLPYLFAVKSFIPSTEEVIFNDSIYDAKTKKWTRKAKEPYSIIPSIEESHRQYKKILNIAVNESNGFVYISIDHKSPIFAKYLLEIIIFEINTSMKNDALNKSNLSLDYLYKQYTKTPLSEIQTVITSVIETEIKNAMMVNSKINYVFDIIDSPNTPQKRYKPDFILYYIFAVMISFIISISYIAARIGVSIFYNEL